jgi:hypothetical protein
MVVSHPTVWTRLTRSGAARLVSTALEEAKPRANKRGALSLTRSLARRQSHPQID